MPYSDEPYSLDEFPEYEEPRSASSGRPYTPDGRLLLCAEQAIAQGVPEGFRDAGAYHLAQQCARVGMGQGEAESCVETFLAHCSGDDKPNARQKVRSAYRGAQHPLGCEFWRSVGLGTCSDCPAGTQDRPRTVNVKRPGSGAKNGHKHVANGHGPTVDENGEIHDSEESHSAPQTSDMALAQAWALEVQGAWLYMDGDQWWTYQEGRWVYSSSDKALASVQEFLQRMWVAGVVKRVTATLVRNVLFLAKSLLGPHDMTEFNQHPAWVSLANGVYDTQNDVLMPHAPEHMLTYQTGYEYVPEAECPTWRRCLREWLIDTQGAPCEEWIYTLQEWFGYCLIPDTGAQAAMFWYGEGANGKGVVTRILEALVGADYCCAIPVEQLHDPYHRAELHGRLVGFVDEPDPKALQRNGNWFKALTGETKISARRPTEKVFSFLPTVRLVVTCNDLPGTRDVSRAFFRRVLMIEWRYNVPDDRKDPELADKLMLELPGILNWALGGLRRFRARNRRFIVPEESQRLLESYRLAEDTIGRFVKEECRRDPEDYTPAKALYREYRKWCDDAGLRPESDNMFGRRLAKMGFVRDLRRMEVGPVRVWHGVAYGVTDSEN